MKRFLAWLAALLDAITEDALNGRL